MEVFKAMRTHDHVISFMESGHKYYFKEHSELMYKAKLVSYCVLEFASKGDLYELLVAGKAGFSEKIARHLFKEILTGLDHFHLNGYAHRDLKLENILIGELNKLKLTDFGFAAPIHGRDQSGFLKTSLGTLGYKAPELLSHRSYRGQNADVFSAGVILFMLVFHHCPFKEALRTDPIYKCIVNNRSDLFWRWHEKQLAKARGVELSSAGPFSTLANV